MVKCSRSGKSTYSRWGVKPGLCVLALLASLALPGAARAAGEKEWQLGARTGLDRVTVDGRSSWGFVAGVDVEYGLSDSWALRASVASSLHSLDREGAMDTRPAGKLITSTGLAGLTYTIDILRLVPYADVQLGVARTDGAVVNPGFAFISATGIGADYYVTPLWTAGAYFQYLFDPFDLFSDPFNLGRSPYGFSAALRISRIF
jgi:hypothetical protein